MDIKKIGILVIIFLFILGFIRYYRIISITNQFQFRQEINITAQQNIVNNSILQIFINTETLISSGKLRFDCRDIEFRLVNGTEELYIPKIIFGCGSRQTEVWLRIPTNISSGSTIRLYMYYGNTFYNRDNDYDRFSDVAIFIGRYFPETRLNNTRYIPVLDITPLYWISAGRRTFERFGSTFICPTGSATFCTQVDIVPYEIGGEGKRIFTVSFDQQNNIIVYKDLLPTNLAENAVLRLVFMPTFFGNYSIVRQGIHGSPDIGSKLSVVTFTCSGRSYRYLFVSEAGTEVGPANTFVFMFCANRSNLNFYTYFLDTRVSYLQETYTNATGICVAYIAPTNNPAGDTNINNFLCSEIQYFDRFANRVFKLDNNRNILAVNITTFPSIRYSFGAEERLVNEPRTYGNIEISTSDSYEKGEEIVVYASVKEQDNISEVYMDIIDYSGNLIYGPVKMDIIAPNIFSAKFNSSLIPVGVYLLRVYAYSDMNIYAGMKAIKIHQKFSELKETILFESNSIRQYLSNYIYPKLNIIEEKIDTLSQFSFSNIIDIKNSLIETRGLLYNIQSTILFVNYSLYSEIVSVREKIEEVLDKVNRILNILQNEYSEKINNIQMNLNLLYLGIGEINQTIDQRVIPTLYVINENIIELNKTVENLRKISIENYKDILFYISILEGRINVTQIYLDEISRHLKCEINSEGTICFKISDALRRIAEIKDEVYETKVLLQDLGEYIRNVLTNKVDNLYNLTNQIFEKQQQNYNLLAEIYSETIKIRGFVTDIKNILEDTRSEILAILIRNENKIDIVKNKIEEVLFEIRTRVIPLIQEANLKIDDVISKIQNITGVLDIRYCDGKPCSKIDDILYRLYVIDKEINEIYNNVQALQPVKVDVNQLANKIDAIYQDLDTIFGDISDTNKDIANIKERLLEVKDLLIKISSELEGRQTYPGVQALLPINPALAGVIAAIFVLLLAAYMVFRART